MTKQADRLSPLNCIRGELINDRVTIETLDLRVLCGYCKVSGSITGSSGLTKVYFLPKV